MSSPTKLTAALVAALTAITAVSVVSAVTAPTPVADLRYVSADPGDSYWSIRNELGLSCTHTELWQANGRSPLDPGTIVFLPPECLTTTTAPATTTPPTTTTSTTTTTTLPPAPVVPPVMLGATIDRRGTETWAQATAAFEQAVGAPVEISRRFTGTFPTSFASVGAFAVDIGQRHRVISVKGTPSRADWDRFLASIPADGYSTWVTINHEPENDGGAMTPAVFRARLALMLEAIDATGRDDLHPTVILMSWLERDANPATSSADWFPAAIERFTLGIDPYENGSGRQLAEIAQPTIDVWVAEGGGPWMITETGTRITGAAGAAWVRNAFAWCRATVDCLAVQWFHSSVGPTGNWWLDDPQMRAAFGEQSGVPR